ncbi:MAG: hypothetical protein IKR78_01060 [Dehalococcoidales bacterium]|nr:hypothetical protein [Dehalococcoidales bacterium]
MSKALTVKNTFNMSLSNYEELKKLVENKSISSITEGINLGIELLIKEKRMENYRNQMAKAAKDKEFMRRTLSSQNEFDKLHDEVLGEW